MRRVTFQSVVDAVAIQWLGDPDDVTTKDDALIRRFVRRRGREYWEKHWWPELRNDERRQYRDSWVSGTAYVVGDEVYYPASDRYFYCVKAHAASTAPADTDDDTNYAEWADAKASYSGEDYSASVTYAAGDIVFYPDQGAHYQCHTASTGNAPTDTSYWGVLNTGFVKSIDLEQTGETEIGRVESICLDNPRATDGGKEYDSLLSGDLVIVLDGPTRPWVRFQRRVPTWTGNAYSATTAYAVGTVIFYNDEDYWEVVAATSAGDTPDSAAAKFSRQDFPYRIAEAVIQAAYADCLRADGQADKFRQEIAEARRMISEEITKVEISEGQAEALPVRVAAATLR